MSSLVQLVRQYQTVKVRRFKIRIAEQLITALAPGVAARLGRRFPRTVNSASYHQTLQAIFLSLDNFQGNTDREFVAFYHRIADTVGTDPDDVAETNTSSVGLEPSVFWATLETRIRFEPLLELVRVYLESADESMMQEIAAIIVEIIRCRLLWFVRATYPTVDPQEILQETCVGILKTLQGFRGTTDNHFLNRCRLIAKNKIITKLRSGKHDPLGALADPFAGLDGEHLSEDMDRFAKEEAVSLTTRLDCDYAMNLLMEAKPECYNYLRKRYIEGRSAVEIALEEGENSATVLRRIGRCLKRARKLVE